ncbi:hypothetical protein ND748_11845 [Frankia sp. AiPs1]|uniref:hypothetical protein n=1 Tax=Frankia sp. AiPs1 TaxID=573493 RepID=UPI0020433369|nr:hypothetical protein [Frankia sp. AiPs1]MCM3922348.1 hypothetical protein [Frankia sp. AiPs1]
MVQFYSGLVAVNEPAEPTWTDDESRDARCHWLLLALSGLVPDELLTDARAWLAEGRRGDVAAAVVQAALAARLVVNHAHVFLLRELYAEAGLPRTTVDRVIGGGPIALGDVGPGYLFASGRPGLSASGEAVAPGVGAPGVGAVRVGAVRAGAAGVGNGAAVGESAAGERDGVVDALLVECAAVPSVRVGWAAWRAPRNGARWPPTRRVFVVETDDDDGMPAIAARVQGALLAAGEVTPQVEVFPSWAEPPPLTGQARLRGALVYLRDPLPEVKYAEFFDGDGTTGPRIAPDHLVLAEPERTEVLSYLSAGTILAFTTGRRQDVLRPAEIPVVPTNIRSDGEWIWDDANSYYLQEYGLAPDLGLLAHIRARGYANGRIDAAALRNVAARLRRP